MFFKIQDAKKPHIATTRVQYSFPQEIADAAVTYRCFMTTRSTYKTICERRRSGFLWRFYSVIVHEAFSEIISRLIDLVDGLTSS